MEAQQDPIRADECIICSVWWPHWELCRRGIMPNEAGCFGPCTSVANTSWVKWQWADDPKSPPYAV